MRRMGEFLAVLALLAQVLLADRGILGSYTLRIILGDRILCRTARKRHEADLGPGSTLEAKADLHTAALKDRL